MAKINQNTLQQIKGTTNVEYTEELSDSIPVAYTKKGSTPLPVEINETEIKAAQDAKAVKMAEHNKIKKIIAKKAKARRNANKDNLADAMAEHMQAVDEYTQEY